MSTAIEWADETWNPVVGCMKVSAGCEHCYAIRTAYRLEHAFKQPQYQGLTRKLPDGSANWTGTVRCLPDRLRDPLNWREPRRVFVNSMSDLFHEDVPDAFIAAVFAVMETAQRHTFQILTKRPARMARLLSNPQFYAGFVRKWGYDALGSAYDACNPGWPMPNVWLGVSVEDQRAADERIPLLLQTPAAVRFLSCEPLLGPVDLREWLDNISDLPPLPGTEWLQPPTTPGGWYQINEFEQPLHWVITGGESGPGARPCDPEWVRNLRDQCQAAGIAFFHKQWGGRTPKANGRELDGCTWDEYPVAVGVL